MRARILTGFAIVAAMGVLAASPARAENRPPHQGGGAYIDGDGNPTAVAEEGTAPVGGSAGGGGAGAGKSECWWEVYVANDHVQPVYEVDGSRQYSTTGRWLAKYCRNGELVDQQPEGGLVDVEALAARAARNVAIPGPAVRTSPDAALLYVHLPTWLWIDPGWWRSYTARAAIGSVTVTATASPVSVHWSTGDGGQLTCRGPGRPWSRGLADEASTCRHTYRRVPEGGPRQSLPLTATVTFHVSWTSNIGRRGSLDPISRSTTVSVRIGEIQAIGTD